MITLDKIFGKIPATILTEGALSENVITIGLYGRIIKVTARSPDTWSRESSLTLKKGLIKVSLEE